MPHPLPRPSRHFRQLRESLDLKLRDVARQSVRVAVEQGDSRFKLSLTTLHGVETNGQVPTLHHLYTLTCTYGLERSQALAGYLKDKPGMVGDTRLRRGIGVIQIKKGSHA